MDLISILGYVIAPLGTAAAWIVGKRKRNNDFITDLQASIDLLAAKNRELMERILEVKEQNLKLISQNTKLISNQEVLKTKIEETQKENNELYSMLEKLGQKPIRQRRKKDETTT